MAKEADRMFVPPIRRCPLTLNEIAGNLISGFFFPVNVDYQAVALFDTCDMIPLLQFKLLALTAGSDRLNTYSPLVAKFIYQ